MRVLREDRRGKAAKLGGFKGAGEGVAVSAKGFVGVSHAVRWFSFLADGQCIALPTDAKTIARKAYKNKLGIVASDWFAMNKKRGTNFLFEAKQ